MARVIVIDHQLEPCWRIVLFQESGPDSEKMLGRWFSFNRRRECSGWNK
jgi:hypothetical protein